MYVVEQICYEIINSQMVEVVYGVCNVVLDDIFIIVGIVGGFIEILLVLFSEKEILEIVCVGVDGLYMYKFDWDDLQDIVNFVY